MLIGIDASRATVAQRTGTESYSLHVIRGLLEAGRAHRFRLYFRDGPPPDLFPAREGIEARVIGRGRLWTHLGLGPDMRRDPPDVLFVPAHVIPWPAPVAPAVVTVHDLGYRHYPAAHRLSDRLYLDWATRHSARATRRVIADSQATARDLTTFYHTPPDKISVVYPGVDPTLEPVSDEGQRAAVRERYGIPGAYILHVGSLQPRKNLARLIQAFAQLGDAFPEGCLVLAGRRGWLYDDLFAEVKRLGLGERVIFSGYVDDGDRATLYSGARVFAFPSLYEGFGFPVLEAMRCGTPVVCSDASSLPELVGEAALTVPPTDVDRLAAALRRALTDEGLRFDLIARGFEQAGRFTWEACARATLAVLEEAAIRGRAI